jgi:hypothetical protein
VLRAGKAPRTDFDSFDTYGTDLLEHFVEREMIVNGIKNADRYLAHRLLRVGSVAQNPGRFRWLGRRAADDWRRRQRAARGSKKTPSTY